MKLAAFNSNAMGQNIYLYYDETRKEGVIIDAGCSKDDSAAIARAITDNSITIKALLLTHGHFDHITAVEDMKALTGAMLYCHQQEKPFLETPALNLSTMIGKEIGVTPDGLFVDGDVFEIGGAKLQVLHTPGHTPGGVCFYDEANETLFTGDTLFRQSIGRTDLPQSSHAVLMDSIKDRLLALPDSIKVYPGHGPSTTIKDERRNFS